MMKRLPDTGTNKPIVLESNGGQHSRNSPLVILDTVEPASGWSNMDAYVAENLKSPEELQIKPVSGTVELSFEVDSQGDPTHIKVTKSLCEKCDEEAVRILKSGPKWKKGKKKKSKIGIRF
jgi:TonB family protein